MEKMRLSDNHAMKDPIALPGSAVRPWPVQVYRTSVQNGAQVERLRPRLDLLVQEGGEWNFDLEDREKILRVDSTKRIGEHIMALLQDQGFTCSELE
jgi:hypothetical protein